VDGYSLVVTSSREFSLKHFETISFPLGLKDHPYLVIGHDDEPIDAALLNGFRGNSTAVWPSTFRDLGSTIRDGILLFVADETGQMYLLTRELPECGRVLGLVADTLHHRFKIALQKAALEAECVSQRSRYPGWTEIEIANGASLLEVDFGADAALSEIRCLQQVLRPSRIALTGGAKAGQSYLSLTRFLPDVVAEGADAVTAQTIDRSENLSLQRTPDAGIWRFSLSNPEHHLDGSYQLRAFNGSELLNRRTISFTTEIRQTDYVSPSKPDLWLGEAGLQESAPPSGWPVGPGDCFEVDEHSDQSVVFESLSDGIGDPITVEQSPVVDELISFLAARSCYQQGIPEFDLVGLLKDHLALKWNSAWYALRAWVEMGAFESLSIRTWRTRKCFARKPCLVSYRIHNGYRVVLFGLVPLAIRKTFEAACIGLNYSAHRKSSLSPWVPELSFTDIGSVDVLAELQRRSGLERVLWLKNISEVVIPIWSIPEARGARPANWDVYRIWDFDRQSFVDPGEVRRHQTIALSWCRRSDRADYFAISDDGSPVWWGWSKTWALLRAYDLAKIVPFGKIGLRSLKTSATHIHLPLPLARAAAITGSFLPGPCETNSNDVSYFYSFASRKLRRMAIQAMWVHLQKPSRERLMTVDLGLLWRQSNSSRQDSLPMPTFLRDKLASDPLLRRFAELGSIPRAMLPILLNLTSWGRQRES
jgi:hypothetical protein